MESDSVGWELLIILLLIIGNGVCSLAEIAIVGVRKNRLHQMVKEGKRGAKQALALAERKEELFSTIQVGITSISIVTGMFSGAALAKPLADILKDIPQVGTYLAPLSMVIVMALVTYAALIVGELAPKWIAIAMPEKAACWVAAPMVLFSTVCKPLVMFSTWSTKVVVGLLGVKMGHEAPVSEEEIRVMLIEGAKSGTIDKEEPELINRIFQLNDITAADRMTPRTQLVWIDLADTEENIWKEINESSHFRLPVGDGSLDNFKGLVDMSDILLDQHTYPDKPIKASIMDTVYKPLYIPETITLTRVLSAFKTAGVHEAVVIDEYGTLSGLITLHDWLEEIVGDMPGDTEDVVEKRNKIIRQSEHAWLVDGALTIDDFREYFHIEEELPGEAESYYKTVAGFITYRLGYIAKETEKVTYKKYTFEVVDCDNRRIDKVLVTEETFREGENDEKR